LENKCNIVQASYFFKSFFIFPLKIEENHEYFYSSGLLNALRILAVILYTVYNINAYAYCLVIHHILGFEDIRLLMKFLAEDEQNKIKSTTL